MNISACVGLMVLAGASLADVCAAAAFTPGNLVVVRVGDGGALGSGAVPVHLDELTTAGTLVQSIAMPTTPSGTSHALVLGGSSTTEGHLFRSTDGRYLTLGGYDAAPGTPSVASTSTATAARVVARVDALGLIDTTTAVTDAYSAGAIRTVVSDDGSAFWIGAGNNGIRYVTLGGGPSTLVNDTGSTLMTNTRVLRIFQGQLYASSAQNMLNGISTISAGLPTTGGGGNSVLSGFGATSTGNSPGGWVIFSPTLLYIADDSAVVTSGGLQRWESFLGGWFQVSLTTSGIPATTRIRYLAGRLNTLGQPELYASATGTAGSFLLKIVDDGASPSFSVIATAPAGMAYKGIEFTPESTGCWGGACVADFDDGSGTGTPDGGVTIDDLLYYLDLFEAGDACADVDDGTGTNTLDGGVTIDDLIYYLVRFEAGC